MSRKPARGAAPSGFAEERQAEFGAAPGSAVAVSGVAASAGAPERRLLKIGPDGRVLIPSDWRQAMELMDNDTLVAHLHEGELRLQGSAVGLQRARAIARKFIRPGESIVDELIADRREEVLREERDD